MQRARGIDQITFILHCWNDHEDPQSISKSTGWRFRLINSTTGKEKVFPDAEALLIGLKEELEYRSSNPTNGSLPDKNT